MESHVGWRSPLSGPVEGPEDQVPENAVAAVVVIGLGQVAAVVPALELRHGEEVVQRSKPKVDVRMLEESVGQAPGVDLYANDLP